MTQLAAKPLRPVPERRASPRTVVACRSALRWDGQPSVPVQIVDVARDGCSLRLDAELTPHQRVEVDMAGLGAVSGRIVWRSESSYGCRFDEPLPSGSITQLFITADMGNVGASAARTLRAKFSPIAALAILGGVTVFSWAGVAGVVLRFA